ncbi:MAG: VWA domain-containing protein [Fibrobacteria bacterium]|nr:VWA domain-containing protein [Fibrobacteria bacterium]
MRISRFNVSLIVFINLFFISGVLAQSRCDLVSSQCIDLTGSDGQTIVVPKNTTRLDEDGLSICLTPRTAVAKSVDLVFVVDQSGSMAMTNDTEFHTPKATQDALRMLDTLAPQSHVGLVSFAGRTCVELPPVEIGAGNNVETMLSTIDQDFMWKIGEEDCVSAGKTKKDHAGTNYDTALTLANEYLRDPAVSPNTEKAIIFLTDGEPSTIGHNYLQEYEDMDKTVLPPVYSIFIGDNIKNENRQRLVELGQITGGNYYQVPANNKDSLENIFIRVVQDVYAADQPLSTVITNVTTGHISSAPTENDHQQQSNGQFKVLLDDLLPLQEGVNQLKIVSQSSKSGESQPEVTHTINISVTGPETPKKDYIELPDSLFDINCVEPSSIFISDRRGNELDSLDPTASNFLVNLETTSGDNNPNVNIVSKVDSEYVSLSRVRTNEYAKTQSFELSSNASKGNNNMELLPGDNLHFYWTHPRDTRDKAEAYLPVQNHSTNIKITDTQGNQLDSLGDLSRFKVVVNDNYAQDSVIVNITTTAGDAETVILRETSSGVFEATIDFTMADNVVAGNTIAEGTKTAGAGTITATTSGISTQAGYSAHSSNIYFTDLNGTVLTTSIETADKFKVVVKDNYAEDSIVVTLTTSDGDAETIILREKSSGVFEATVDFKMEPTITPGNSIAEGKRVPGGAPGTINVATSGSSASIAYPAYATTIYFTDMAGNIITNMDSYDMDKISQFKVVVTDDFAEGPIPVTITTTDGDSETSSLKETTPGVFEATINFTIKTPVTPDNNTAEGLPITGIDPYKAGTLSAQANGGTANLSYLASVSELYFLDMNGNVITNLDNFMGNQFIVVYKDNKNQGPFDIKVISPSSGDTVVANVKASGIPAEYRDTLSFVFASQIDPTNKVLEGLNSNDTTTAFAIGNVGGKTVQSTQLMLVESFDSAWIIDGDKDGKADTVFVKFNMPLSSLPVKITDITWPSSSDKGKTAENPAGSPSLNQIHFAEGDSSLIIIDLSEDEFSFGLTEASATEPPSLRSPGGVLLPISDKVGPVLISAEKKPSDYKRYATQDSVVHTYPDTLIVTLSEKVIPVPGVANPYSQLLYYYPTEDAAAPVLLPVLSIVPLTPDSLVWQVVIPAEHDSTALNTEDNILLNPNAPFTDAAGNTPLEAPSETDGRDGKKNFVTYKFRDIISGHTDYTNNASFDDDIPILDVNGVEVGTLENLQIKEWVPPLGLQPDGSVIDVSGSCPSDVNNQVPFPPNCLSSMLVLTEIVDGPYTAYINIYDHLGKFVYQSVQRFGFCGEIDNPARHVNGRVMNDLVWNQKTMDSTFVGSGVFIWKVNIKFQSGATRELLRRHGIARSIEPSYNCVSSF